MKLTVLTAHKISQSHHETTPTDYSLEEAAAITRGVTQPHSIVGRVSETVKLEGVHSAQICAACPAFELNMCAAMSAARDASTGCAANLQPLASTTHTIPARRMISHPKEWSDYVTIICDGWAASSITLPDGRRQILSFLMPGDLVSTACLFEPISGRSVEAITEVVCRKYKRSECKDSLFKHPDVLERLSRTWNEERAQSDQLALDLGRRTADERIARLIINLAERAAKRGMKHGQTMEFPLRQRHVADATGLTPVHVSKVLGAFQRSGMITIGGRSLTIDNEAELRRVADWRF